MKKSITFRTELNIDKVSSILGCSKSELIEFLLTTKHDFNEVMLFANGIDTVVNGCDEPCAWYFYHGRSYNLKKIPYTYWVQHSSYTFFDRLHLCLYCIDGVLVEMEKSLQLKEVLEDDVNF